MLGWWAMRVESSGVRLAVVSGGDYDLASPDGRFATRIVGAVARKEPEDAASGCAPSTWSWRSREVGRAARVAAVYEERAVAGEGGARAGRSSVTA